MKQETALQASYTLLCPLEALDVTGYNHVRMRRNMMIFNADRLYGRQNVACPDEGEPLGTLDTRRVDRIAVLSLTKR